MNKLLHYRNAVRNKNTAAGSEAENVIKIRKGGQVRCNLVGLTDMTTHDDLRSTIARHIEECTAARF
jgi:hypothetical protein